MIEVEGLRKQYGTLTAVDDVSFKAEAGKIFGLLGPNGAGKTTTISCISGLVKPDSGRVSVMGHNVVTDGTASRERLGVVPQELALYEDLTARENLNYWGAAYGLRGDHLRRRVNAVLELTELDSRAADTVKKLSGGMKRRLNFGCALVHEPRALLLDEPTVGVDPQSRVKLLDLVREEASNGTCVLYTTHYMEEAETLCDRLAIVDNGKIIAHGTLDQLRAQIAERDLLRLAGTFEPSKVEAALTGLDGVQVVQAEKEAITIALPEATRNLSIALQAVAASGGQVRETTLTRPNLESLFIKLTGKELRE